MSDNYTNNHYHHLHQHPIPINVNSSSSSSSSTQQRQSNAINITPNNIKSVSIHSTSINNHNGQNNQNVNVKISSTSAFNNGSTSNKIMSNDNDFEYLDLNELDAIINKLKNDSYNVSSAKNSPTSNIINNEISPKSKNRLSLIETNANTTATATQTVSSPSPQNNSKPQNHHHHHHHHHHRRYEIVLLKELMQFGIKKEKLEKALAATGYQTSLEAINWLMKHSRDPMLLNDSIISTRDYMLVMCPIGRLAAQISTFFQQSKIKCGANEAHYNNLLPYMKLSPFFKLPDSEVSNLHKAFDLVFKNNTNPEMQTQDTNLITTKKNRIKEINLDLHVSSQMILIYPDIDSENLIKEIVSTFSAMAFKQTDFEIIPYSKQLHLTLAYNFDTEHKRTLEELAIQHINYRALSDWEIRLYSRDSRADSKMTYKVISPFKAKNENELNLKVNDHIFAASNSTNISNNNNTTNMSSSNNINSSSSNNNGKDTVMKGVSFASGESGYFPSKNVERAIESDTWKLHKSSIFVNPTSTTNSSQPSPSSGKQPSSQQLVQNQQAQQQPQQTQQYQQPVQQNQNQAIVQQRQRTSSVTDKNARNSFTNSEIKSNATNLFFSENLLMQKKFQANPHKSMQTSGLLRFFFVRHGERIDLAFGPQWIEQAFDRSGKYRRINLNMPNDLPVRTSKREFLGDSPLTEVGQFQARLTGDALGNEGYKIHYCYVSPALRCIQTAHHILTAQGLEKTVKIRIEPSVFEFLGWYDKGLPTFLNYESLLNFGYNIDVNYRPLLPIERLQADENYTDYYQRSFNVTKYLTNLHQNEGANMLIVGHAGTLEVCTRQICGLPVRTYTEFNATIRKVPYLGLCLLEKDAASNIFEIQPAVIPPIGHTANFNFDPVSLKI